MKILVTGASGFIGSNFIKNNIDNQITSVDLLLNDITSFNFKGNDVLLHCAAIVHQTKKIAEDEFFRVNSDLTYKVAQKAKSEGVKHFIFLSTVKVYGESNINKIPWNELSECNPLDAYGKSKLDAEKRILPLQDKKFKISIIRSPLVYGAGVKANMFNLIKLVYSFPILPFGKINNKRNFVYVGNLISLINQIIRKGIPGMYIACDNENLSTTDLVIKLRKSLNKKNLLISMPNFSRKFISKAFPSYYDRLWGSLEVNPKSGWKRIQFAPPFAIEHGIDEMVGWYLGKKKRNDHSN